MSELIYERSRPGRRGLAIPTTDLPIPPVPDGLGRKTPPRLPELAEPEVMRHFTKLSTRNFGIDSGFYPLGSCTMKYNPRVNERLVGLPGFRDLHPLADEDAIQGALELEWNLQEILLEVTGLDAVSLQPAAGSQGELTGLLLMRAYFEDKGESEQRRKIVIPDTAHGTNPASVTMAGYEMTPVATDQRGNIDVEDLRAKVDERHRRVDADEPVDSRPLRREHRADPRHLPRRRRPDVLRRREPERRLRHLTARRHGLRRRPHQPAQDVRAAARWRRARRRARSRSARASSRSCRCRSSSATATASASTSTGRARSARCAGSPGPFGVFVRSYAFMRAWGPGLREMSEVAVLNANYMLARLKDAYELPYDRLCMHEFVLSARNLKREHGVTALDVAKRLMDFDFHPPTVYFPLVVPEALMIEPTETEAKETLDAFCEAMLQIAREAATEPELVRSAPHGRPVERLDEVRAAKTPVVRYTFE